MEANVAIYDIKSKRHNFKSRTSKLIPLIREPYRRARYLIKKFIGCSYDIGFLCSIMRIEANRAIYHIKSEKHDFESRTRKLVRQIREAHRRARYLIKKFIGGSYDIEFWFSNTRIVANGAIYCIKS